MTSVIIPFTTIKELSIGPGFADWSPTEAVFHSSYPTYVFHWLNHFASSRYLSNKAHNHCKKVDKMFIHHITSHGEYRSRPPRPLFLRNRLKTTSI